MDKLNDLKNRLEVFNTLGNASNSHETTAAIPNEKTDFLQKDNESKSIITQNILENENLLLRNKDKRNIEHDSIKVIFLLMKNLYHIAKLLRCLKTLETTKK